MFWKRRNVHDTYDEYYAERPIRSAREFAPFWIHLCLIGVVGAAALLVVWGVAGRPMVERFLKQLIAPVGVVWVGLGLLSYFSLVRRAPWPACAGLVLWVTLTVGGNLFVRQWMVRAVEAQYFQTDIDSLGNFDAVVVLGGGTNSTPAGKPQLVGGGDRVLMGAQLYHSGQAAHLVATGRQSLKTSAAELDRSQETRLIWMALRIPEDAITTLGGGNTYEELQSLTQWLRARYPTPDAAPPRVGLVTSAWHLPRATRLAQTLGLEVVPIPCDFLWRRYEPDPSIIVPSADNLAVTAKVLYERLGSWLGR